MRTPFLRISLLVGTVAALGACGKREEPAPAAPPAAETPAATTASPATTAAAVPEPAAPSPAAPQTASEAPKTEPAAPPASGAAPAAAKPKGPAAPAKSIASAPAPAAAVVPVAPAAAPPATAPAPAPPAPKQAEAAPAPKAAASGSKVSDPGGDVAVPAKAGTTRIGAEKCRMCHKLQYDSWAASAHAKRTPPLDCESCHGAGSDYKTLGVMKDPGKAKAAGLVLPDAPFCARCHKGTVDAAYLAKAHAHKAKS